MFQKLNGYFYIDFHDNTIYSFELALKKTFGIEEEMSEMNLFQNNI